MASYNEMLERYKDAGIEDGKLRTIEHVKTIFGYDITTIKGYQDLMEEHRKLFCEFFINYFNGIGLAMKCKIIPKSIHYVEKITYCICFLRPSDEENEPPYLCRELAAERYYILLQNGKKKLFKNNVCWPEILPENYIEAARERFLRFDYKEGKYKVWFHIMGPDRYY